jgi:hypothetical protein
MWLPLLLAVNLAFNESGAPVIDEKLLLPPFFVLSFGYSSWKFVQVCYIYYNILYGDERVT